MINRDMFYFADIDEKFIESTKSLHGLEDGVLIHCQQCIEKNLKGIIRKRYGVANKEQNLVKLLEVLYIKDYPELKRYKGLCRDFKDFYFSRRYESDDYEILTDEEYDNYLEKFYELLKEVKNIREK